MEWCKCSVAPLLAYWRKSCWAVVRPEWSQCGDRHQALPTPGRHSLDTTLNIITSVSTHLSPVSSMTDCVQNSNPPTSSSFTPARPSSPPTQIKEALVFTMSSLLSFSLWSSLSEFLYPHCQLSVSNLEKFNIHLLACFQLKTNVRNPTISMYWTMINDKLSQMFQMF